MGSSISVTQGIVADCWRPMERGWAMGVYMTPLLVGPILAPIIGGALSAAMDWRATFILLSALGVLIFAIAFCLPETHQWMVVQRRKKLHDAVVAAAGAAAVAPLPAIAEEALIQPPSMQAPWVPLRYLFEPELAPYVAVGVANFATMFVSLTAFPALLADAPYGLTEAAIGACYLPVGVGMLLGSNCGGVISDRFGARSPGVPTARLVPSLLGSLLLPVGCLIYGLCFHWGTHLAGPLVGHFLIGLGCAWFGPGQMAYLSQCKQDNAAGVAAASTCFNFVMSGVLISAAPPLQARLGLGGFFGLLAAVMLAMKAWAAIDVVLRARTFAAHAARQGELEKPTQTATVTAARLPPFPSHEPGPELLFLGETGPLERTTQRPEH